MGEEGERSKGERLEVMAAQYAINLELSVQSWRKEPLVARKALLLLDKDPNFIKLFMLPHSLEC